MKRSYKKMAVALSLVLALTSVIAATPATGEAKARINKKSVTLSVGDSVKLKVKGTKKRVRWSSNNPYVAVVTSSGRVYAYEAGTAKITAKVKKKKYTCRVTVRGESVPTQAPAATPIAATPVPTVTPVVTPAPDVNSNVNTLTNSTLAANIQTSMEKMESGEVLVTVTNKNSVMVKGYTLNAQMKNASGTVLNTWSDYGHTLAAGATAYHVMWGSSENLASLDVTKTLISVTADNDYYYYEKSDKVQVSGAAGTEGSVALTYVNTDTTNTVYTKVVVLYKNAQGKIIAAKEDSASCTPGQTSFSTVSAPTYRCDGNGHEIYDDLSYVTFEVIANSYYYAD